MSRYVVAIVLLCLCISSLAFAQGGNAQLGGVVTDQSNALIPGATITATNTETGVSTTAVTNETGSYNFASLQPGKAYRITATLPGFQTKTVTNLDMGAGTSSRQNFQLSIATTATTVEVISEANSAITAAGASVGDVLPEYRIRNLPLVGNNVLDLLQILPGLRLSPIGSASNTIGGLSINTINVTRDGMRLTDPRIEPDGGTLGGGVNYTGGTNLLSPTVMNPDLVGEIRLILAPVDAELGGGNSQIQISTRSGTNRFTGSAVWNIQNTALNPNTWGNNNDVDATTGQWSPTKPNWRNNNQYTVSFGGPIIKNKTFFFALWDQNISNTRELQQNRVLTNEARNGIFRFWEGWVADSGDLANDPNPLALPAPTSGTASVASVDFAGKPRKPLIWPDGTPYTGRLVCFSIFGNVKVDGNAFGASDCPGGTDSRGNTYTGFAFNPTAGNWDPRRPAGFNSSGYFAKILAKMPKPNDFMHDANGDGLISANHRWILRRDGNNTNESIVGTEAYSNRKQINLKIDQNFASHRINGSWTYQLDDSADSVGDWPGAYSGQTSRRPQVFVANITSTLSSSLLNEGRFGINYNKAQSVPAWLSPDQESAEAARSFLVNGGKRNGVTYPVVVAPTVGGGATGMTFNTGVMETTTGVTQVGITDPIYNFADTVSWSRGKHSFKFGADLRYPRGKGFSSQPYPIATYGNGGNTSTISPFNDATAAGTLLLGALTGGSGAIMRQDTRDLATNLAYILTDSIGNISYPLWIENQSDVASATWQDTSTRENRYRETVSSEYTFFAKDDFKLTPRLTLNLGVRYEYYAPPYVRSGLTSTTIDQGNGLFGANRTASAGGKLFDNWLQPGNLYLTGYGTNPTGGALRCEAGVQQSARLPVSTCDPKLMTNIEFVGPNSPNPGKTVIPRDRNNLGPAIGFAYQLPWFGEGKTTVRGGYQVTFSSVRIADNVLASALGSALNLNQNMTTSYAGAAGILATRAINVGDIPALVPLTAPSNPGQAVPIYARSASTTSFDPNYQVPYTQNLTLSVTRSVTRAITLDVRYVGTLARKQEGSLNLNTSTAHYNKELFDALERTRRGEDVPLFDQMLAGLRLAGVPAAYGTTNGTTSRGSQQLRLSTTGAANGASLATRLGNGDFVGIANILAGNTNPAAGLQTAATLPAAPQNLILRNGCNRIANNLYNPDLPASATNIATRCFAENYLIANPQLNNATYNANLGRSNYHSLQVQFSLRPVQGISFQSTYSFAKSMQLGGGFTDPLMRDLDRQRGREGPHSFRTNGTFELPIGPNKLLFANSSGWVARLIERWQTSFIMNLASGSPADIIGAQSMRYGNGRYVVASPYWQIPKGEVTWDGPGGNSGLYYGNNFVALRDPQCADTSLVAAQLAATNCTLTAVGMIVPAGTPGAFPVSATDTRSVVYGLVNPKPGELGTLGPRTLVYWGQFSLDANAQKTFRLTESKQLALRIDTENILNHPQVAIPNYFVGNTPFGQINSKTGGRSFQGQLRLTF